MVLGLFNSEILEITVRSLLISSTATILSTSWSIPIALILVHKRFKGKNLLVSVFNAMIGIPTVIVGLILYLLLTSRGPLGNLNLLFTPMGMTIGQAILITPLITSLAYEILYRMKNMYWEVALTLGADNIQANLTMLREAYSELIVIILIAFSRALGELGVALMIGGNIKGYTRVFTTVIALEVSKGNFDIALSLGIILLLIVSTITALLRILGGKME